MIHRSDEAGIEIIVKIHFMFFRRKRRRRRRAPDWLINLGAQESLWRLQLSEWLGRKAAGLSQERLRWYCLFFMLLWCLVNTWVLVGALGEPWPRPDFKSMTLPVRVGKANRRPAEGRSSFGHFMDSMRTDILLKERFDSLLRVRPGFADTIRTLEGIYPGEAQVGR